MLFGLGKNKNKGKSAGGNAGGVGAGGDKRNQTSRLGRKSRIGNIGRKGGAPASINKLFHGVAVRARGDACCDAVNGLGAQRFLSEEAPLLPLAECSNPQGCRCVYEHFDERRDNLRREVDVGMPVRTYPEEKREGHGRRITDG